MEVTPEPIEQSRERRNWAPPSWTDEAPMEASEERINVPPRPNRPAPEPDAVTRDAQRKLAAARRNGKLIDELLDLSKRAKEGDSEAEAKVVLLLGQHPELVQEIGDLSGRAMLSLVIEATDDLLVLKLSMLRREAALRRELVGENATVLEKLAADNVIVAMRHQQFIDVRYSLAAKYGRRLNDWVKVQDAAAKRVDRSLKSLALVQQHAAKTGRTKDDSESSKNLAPGATASTKAKAGKSRTKSKPAKRKPTVTVADMPPIVCNEEQHCETRVRPRKSANRTTRKPANRVAEFVGSSGAPMSVNGQANHELPIADAMFNGAGHSLG